MKTLRKLTMTTLILPATMLFATPVAIHEVGELPSGCQAIGTVKVGDTAFGYRARTDVFADASKEASTRGGNYVSIDVQRVNNAKQGIYYWGWGTVATCK